MTLQEGLLATSEEDFRTVPDTNLRVGLQSLDLNQGNIFLGSNCVCRPHEWQLE